MNISKQGILVFSALVLGIGGPTVAAQAKAEQCTSAECACERALDENTVEALEEFLKKYQHDASSKDTACGALGVPPEDESFDDRKADYDHSLAQPDGVSTE